MTTPTVAQHPIPGPRAFPLFGKQANLLRFYRNPFRLLRSLHATYGDVVALAQGDPSFVFAFGPEMNHQLLAQPELFENGTGPLLRLLKNTAVERLFAQNLAVMNGAHHKQQRRLMQPAFHRQQVHGYCADMVALTQRTLDHWQPHTSINLLTEMQQLMRTRSIGRQQTKTLITRMITHQTQLYTFQSLVTHIINREPGRVHGPLDGFSVLGR